MSPPDGGPYLHLRSERLGAVRRSCLVENRTAFARPPFNIPEARIAQSVVHDSPVFFCFFLRVGADPVTMGAWCLRIDMAVQ